MHIWIKLFTYILSYLYFSLIKLWDKLFSVNFDSVNRNNWYLQQLDGNAFIIYVCMYLRTRATHNMKYPITFVVTQTSDESWAIIFVNLKWRDEVFCKSCRSSNVMFERRKSCFKPDICLIMWTTNSSVVYIQFRCYASHGRDGKLNNNKEIFQ